MNLLCTWTTYELRQDIAPLYLRVLEFSDDSGLFPLHGAATLDCLQESMVADYSRDGPIRTFAETSPLCTTPRSYDIAVRRI